MNKIITEYWNQMLFEIVFMLFWKLVDCCYNVRIGKNKIHVSPTEYSKNEEGNNEWSHYFKIN